MGTKRGLKRAWLEWAVEQETDDCLLFPFGPSQRYARIWLPDERRTVPGHWVILAMKKRKIPVGDQVVRHLCGVTRCLNHRHLKVGTVEENEADKKVHGTACIGERHHSAVLTEDEVRLIRASSESGAAIARRLGMNHRTINRIRCGDNWSHVK